MMVLNIVGSSKILIFCDDELCRTSMQTNIDTLFMFPRFTVQFVHSVSGAETAI